jgi:hypothetical protein
LRLFDCAFIDMQRRHSQSHKTNDAHKCFRESCWVELATFVLISDVHTGDGRFCGRMHQASLPSAPVARKVTGPFAHQAVAGHVTYLPRGKNLPPPKVAAGRLALTRLEANGRGRWIDDRPVVALCRLVWESASQARREAFPSPHRPRRGMRPFLLVALSIAVLACQSGREQSRLEEVEEISAAHTKELARFEQAQAEFAGRNPTPRRLDFAGDGTVLVHESVLQGYPGREEFWLTYTWINTTGQAVEAVVIELVLRDPTSGIEQREEMELELPFSVRLGPDSTYTTFLHAPARGIVFGSDLDWSLRPRVVRRGSGA